MPSTAVMMNVPASVAMVTLITFSNLTEIKLFQPAENTNWSHPLSEPDIAEVVGAK